MPGPLAELVVTSPHLKLSLPTIKTQEVAVSDFAEMSLPAYAKLHTVVSACSVDITCSLLSLL